MDELPDAGEVDPSNLPDKAFFEDRECDLSLRYCSIPYDYILPRRDGRIGYAQSPRIFDKPGLSPSDHYRFDADHKWEVKDGFLVLSWNRAFAANEFTLTSRNAKYLFGSHSNEPTSRMLTLGQKIEN